jgi:hypothetical protein
MVARSLVTITTVTVWTTAFGHDHAGQASKHAPADVFGSTNRQRHPILSRRRGQIIRPASKAADAAGERPGRPAAPRPQSKPDIRMRNTRRPWSRQARAYWQGPLGSVKSGHRASKDLRLVSSWLRITGFSTLRNPLRCLDCQRMLQRVHPEGFIRPRQPYLSPRPPAEPRWIHEIKHDGYQIVASRRGENVRLWSRKAKGWTPRPCAR